MTENRHAPRQRVFKTATIDFDGSGGSFPCAVRNVSEAGAAIEIDGFVALPRNLTLSIAPDHPSRPCHVVWRKGKRVGVRFE
jgi:hypothetical protein